MFTGTDVVAWIMNNLGLDTRGTFFNIIPQTLRPYLLIRHLGTAVPSGPHVNEMSWDSCPRYPNRLGIVVPAYLLTLELLYHVAHWLTMCLGTTVH